MSLVIFIANIRNTPSLFGMLFLALVDKQTPAKCGCFSVSPTDYESAVKSIKINGLVNILLRNSEK